MNRSNPTESGIDPNAPAETVLYETIKDCIIKSLVVLRNKERLTKDDIGDLEKLTRIYCNLKDDLREDMKTGLWKNFFPKA
jgi:hypothetical protein